VRPPLIFPRFLFLTLRAGMDNSPLWDEAMAAIDLLPGMVPPYNRSDDKIVNATDRPTKWYSTASMCMV